MDNRFISGGQTNKSPSAIIGQKGDRSGMSETAWNWVLSAVEIFTDFVKGIMVVGGIIAAVSADFIMGSISVTSLINNNTSHLYNLPSFGFGAIISMGTSAIQIFMWSLIKRRGITLRQIFSPKTLPKDVQGFMAGALILWICDTIMDVAPLALLFTNANYLAFPTLYKVLIGIVSLIVFILCGFSEILTSNMRSMLVTTGMTRDRNVDYGGKSRFADYERGKTNPVQVRGQRNSQGQRNESPTFEGLMNKKKAETIQRNLTEHR